jgi:hypothetical protein
VTHRRGWSAVTAVLAVAAVACSDPDLAPEPDEPSAAADGEGGSGAPERSGVPERSGTEGSDVPEGSDDVHGDAMCDSQVLAAIDETIAGQLAAFAADDFAGALEFASESFRAGTDVETFTTLIEDGYPVAADAESHSSTVCVLQGPMSAEVLVEVTASDGTEGQLVYLLVDEDDVWRIAGAAELTPSDAPPGTVA